MPAAVLWSKDGLRKVSRMMTNLVMPYALEMTRACWVDGTRKVSVRVRNDRRIASLRSVPTDANGCTLCAGQMTPLHVRFDANARTER